MRSMRRWTAIGFACALGACGGGGTQAATSGSGSMEGASIAKEVVAGKVSAALTRVTSCDDLLTRIQNDVASKIALQAELMKSGQAANGGVTGVGIAEPGRAVDVSNTANTAGAAPASGAPLPGQPSSAAAGNAGVGTAAPTTPGAKSASGSAPDQSTATLGPAEHSDTNVQVEGVDEADIVKNDGTHIYLLHGNQLFVLSSWPAKDTSILGKAPIEGTANELFVDHGKVAVFSSVYDQGDLIANTTPKGADPALAPRYFGSPFTKITLLDTTDPTAPKVTRELFLEGNYLSARLYGTTVRTVIRGGFRTPDIYAGNIDYEDPWGRKYPQDQIDQQADEWRDRMLAAVDDTTLDDWLPTEREVIDGKITPPKRRCTDFYAPSPALTDYGLTNVVAFDIQDPKSALSGALVLGAADQVYSSEKQLVLAHLDYRFEQGLIERERTVLHSFTLAGADTTYAASGFVPGHILDQFSIDERDGVIRVATTARLIQNFVPPLPAVAAEAMKQDAIPGDGSSDTVKLARQTENRVVTVKASGSELKRLGMTEPLGMDGETLQSSRFVGDLGYVVTFHQIDPLIVVDLSKPESPTKLGELDIPGFSDYMHPIDDSHLVTIGQDADPSTGQVRGLMLQIFDVSDPTNPMLSHKFSFGPNGYSEANTNHKAFTYFAPTAARDYDGVLAFPYVNYTSTFQSALEVFTISTQNGFVRLGEIDHTKLLQQVCGVQVNSLGNTYYFNQCVQPEIRRGLFSFDDSGDFVYSVSDGGVMAHNLTNLMTPVASVPLPLPDYSDHRMCYASSGSCAYPGASGGGSTGIGIATPTVTSPQTPPPVPESVPGMSAGSGSSGSAGSGM